MVPAGADAVVMLENTGRTETALMGSAPLQADFRAHGIEVYRPAAVGEACIQPGEDIHEGDLVLSAGHTLRPQDIGGLLALGITEIAVARQPRVGIVSQGDEVVAPDVEPGPGQVRDINSYTLAAMVQRAGGIPLNYPIAPDRQEALDAMVRQAYDESDLVVITAGSSVSYRDLTANSINKLGKPGVLVHGVSIRPGKPTILAVCDGKPVFGLPGNPVSCINIFRHFVEPTLRMMLGAQTIPAQTVQARLEHNIPGGSGRTDYVRVRVEEQGGELRAVPVFGKSNLIFTLVRSERYRRDPIEQQRHPRRFPGHGDPGSLTALRDESSAKAPTECRSANASTSPGIQDKKNGCKHTARTRQSLMRFSDRNNPERNSKKRTITDD